MPKVIPLPTGETIHTMAPNGEIPKLNERRSESKSDDSARDSPCRSRSIESKRQEIQQRNRSSSAQNNISSSKVHRPSSNGSSRIEPQKYRTISHSIRKRSNHLSILDTEQKSNDEDQNDEMKRYLKQLVDDMQTIKVEMNKIRQTSATRIRSDSLRLNLKEIRHDIDAIRARMAMSSKPIHA